MYFEGECMYSWALDQNANGSSSQGERDNARKRISRSLHLLVTQIRTEANAAEGIGGH